MLRRAECFSTVSRKASIWLANLASEAAVARSIYAAMDTLKAVSSLESEAIVTSLPRIVASSKEMRAFKADGNRGGPYPHERGVCSGGETSLASESRLNDERVSLLTTAGEQGFVVGFFVFGRPRLAAASFYVSFLKFSPEGQCPFSLS